MDSKQSPPQPNDADSFVGSLFADRYRITRVVSEGATTLVSSVLDEHTGRHATIKIVRARLSAKPSIHDQFDETMRGVAALSHPNIAPIYDWGFAPIGTTSVAYVVIEQLTGGSLRDMFDRGRRLTPSQALTVGLDACRALDYAHQRGFVHGELTPGKVLFGDDRRLRIIDFGLSELLGAEAWTHLDSLPTHVAWYAAPEQGPGQVIDGKADVYALSLILHEAVTGTLPFKSDSTVATLAARQNKLMPVSADLGALASVLERSGRPEPDERSTAAEFGASLVRAAAKLPRPEPLPLLSTGLFDVPPEQMRSPDDPTGGVHRPASMADADADEIDEVPADTDPADGYLVDAEQVVEDVENEDVENEDVENEDVDDEDVDGEVDDAVDDFEEDVELEDVELEDVELEDVELEDVELEDVEVEDVEGVVVDDVDVDGVVEEFEGDAEFEDVAELAVADVEVGESDDDVHDDDVEFVVDDDDVDADEGGVFDEEVAEIDVVDFVEIEAGAGEFVETASATAVPEAPVIIEADPDLEIDQPADDDLVIIPVADDPAVGGGPTTPIPVISRDAVAPADPRSSGRKTVKLLTGLLIAVALVGLGALAYVLFRTPTHAVPDLVGIPQEQATTAIEQFNWVVSIQNERSDEVPEAGNVVRTVPGEGTDVPEGDPFLLVISDGPVLRTLPDLTGMTSAQAQTALQDIQLNSRVSTDFDEKQPADHIATWAVQGQPDLVAGDQVEPGTTVNLVVSDGPAPRTVPDLVGSSNDDAAHVLGDLQLVPMEGERQFSDTVPAGQVISQDPAAGTEVARDSTVIFYVSKGVDLVEFPELDDGLTYDEAYEILTEAGFQVRLALGDSSGVVESYKIAGEPAQPGQTYKRGTQIDVTAV